MTQTARSRALHRTVVPLVLATGILALFVKYEAFTRHDGNMQNAFSDGVMARLGPLGYRLAGENTNTGLVTLALVKGDCDLRIHRLTAAGWHRDFIDRLPDRSSMKFYYGGQLYAEQPVWRTRRDLYWTKILRYFGFAASRFPVLALSEHGSCSPADLASLGDLRE